MRRLTTAAMILLLLGLTACKGGSTGVLTGKVVDGYGNPLGGDAVSVTLSGNPVVNRPDQFGNFIIHAPVGDYTLAVAFHNPEAGIHLRVTQPVRVTQGSRSLGTFTLQNIENMVAWEEYCNKKWYRAIFLFQKQAESARSGEIFLPYLRFGKGDEDQNAALTMGVHSAENGLGWCYARGLGDYDEGRSHFEAALSGGLNNVDAKVGLAGITFGDGDAAGTLALLNEVIDEPGLYDSSQVHDNIRELDLKALKAFTQFLLRQDGYCRDTLRSIEDDVVSQGNTGSQDLVKLINSFL